MDFKATLDLTASDDSDEDNIILDYSEDEVYTDTHNSKDERPFSNLKDSQDIFHSRTFLRSSDSLFSCAYNCRVIMIAYMCLFIYIYIAINI